MGAIPIIRAQRPQAPGIIRSGRNATRDDVFVYWVSPKGEIEPAPDTRISEAQMRRIAGYEYWRRFEAVGAREIKKVSLILSRQMWEKKKQMTVQQRLREKATLDQLAFRAQLRAAQGFSKNDVDINRQILARTKKNEDTLMQLIVSEFDPTKRASALEIELKVASDSPLHLVGAKREGLA